jgi:tetratricopeptide (TPR) repeat protein
LAAIPIAVGQDSGIAPKIFADNSESVFLITVRSDSGDVVGEATGFIIKDGKILTNKHVVDEGSVYVHFGPVRLPAIVEKTDLINDLALLKVEGDLTFKPLTLNPVAPEPGTNIYAIGNPAGLERSISTGVVAGSRMMEGRQLLQITSPISPGSSGGPIFDANGEVVAIAVGILERGQNLNFAVPAAIALKWLRGETDADQDIGTIFAKIDLLKNERDKVGLFTDEGIELSVQINEQLSAALDRSNNDYDTLLAIAEKSINQNHDIGIRAAENAVKIKPDREATFALSRALHEKSLFSENDREILLERAEKYIRASMSTTKQPTAIMYFTLADIIEDRGLYAESNTNFKHALRLSKNRDEEIYFNSVRGIIRTATQLENMEECELYFGLLKSAEKATWVDWHLEAARMEFKRDYLAAGKAYWQSAAMGGTWTSWCQAARSLFGSEDNFDDVLMLSRKCIELAAGEDNSDKIIADAHDSIAWVLNARGVYSEAEKSAREAVTLDPTNGFAFHRLSVALSGINKRQEAINAARQAIRLSDGKYDYMHFQLAMAYFDVEDWDSASKSFERAAQLNPKSETAAYNLGLCLARLRYYRDAANWFEESLRRNPAQSNRNDIVRRIQMLRE